MSYYLSLNERKLSIVKCLIETYTSENEKKKKEHYIKSSKLLPNLIANRRNRKELHLLYRYR